MRPAEVMPTITFAPAAHSCSATRTAYGPPMVRGTIPQGTPFSVMARMDVWKHAHDFTGDVRPSSASLSDRSPSKSSTHSGGTGSFAKLRSARTASISRSGVNAEGDSSECCNRGESSCHSRATVRQAALVFLASISPLA